MPIFFCDAGQVPILRYFETWFVSFLMGIYEGAQWVSYKSGRLWIEG